MRRVLHVVTAAQRRGAEVFASELAPALDELGWSSSLVALARGPGDLDVSALGSRRLAPRTLGRLRRLIREASVVVGHGSSTLPACVFAGTGLSTPFVYRSVGDPRYWAQTTTKRLRTAWLMRRARRVVALTAEAAEILRSHYGLKPERLVVIPKGVQSERLPERTEGRQRAARASLGIPERARVALYLGSLTEEKNPAMAIEAVAAVQDLALVVVGTGPQRAMLDALASRDAPDRVRFLGDIADPIGVLTAADVLVLPSRTEGMPGVAMEAAMVGIPVVATDVGWTREVVIDGVTGVVVPPNDAAALARGLATALVEAATLGPAGRGRCLELFEIRVVARKWDRMLADVTDQPAHML